MTAQIVSVNRKKYAAGLFWQPVGVATVARNYARNLAHSIDKKLNLFTEYRAMIGLGGRKYGHRPGMSAIAALVMESLAEYTSFLAVFRAGNNYLLVAVRNGIILEDKLIDSADAARAEYIRLSQIPDWAAYIAPAEWAMPRAVERNLSDMVSAGAHAELHRISRAQASLLSLLIMAMFIIGILYFFRAPIAEMASGPRVNSGLDPELAAEYRRQIEEKERELAAEYNPEPVVEPIVLPYDYLPDVMARAQTCYQAIGFLMQPISGWTQTFAECGMRFATARVTRTHGNIGQFYDTIIQTMRNVFVEPDPRDGDNTMNLTAALPDVESFASLDERDGQTVAQGVMALFQQVGVDASVNVRSDFVTNGVETADFSVVEVAATSKLVPMQFMQIFGDFGGVVMTKCTWDAVSRTWNYEVMIYAK